MPRWARALARYIEPDYKPICLDTDGSAGEFHADDGTFCFVTSVTEKVT